MRDRANKKLTHVPSVNEFRHYEITLRLENGKPRADVAAIFCNWEVSQAVAAAAAAPAGSSTHAGDNARAALAGVEAGVRRRRQLKVKS